MEQPESKRMGLFSRRHYSRRVQAPCLICEKRIDFAFVPTTKNEAIVLSSHYDVDEVNICKKCGGLRHAACAATRHDQLASASRRTRDDLSLAAALRRAIEGDDRTLHSFLERETRGLDCPRCGSMEFAPAFVAKDGTEIIMKSGKRQ
jgi:hypothetical protein